MEKHSKNPKSQKNLTQKKKKTKVLTTVEEREPTMEDLRDPKTEEPRGSLPTSLISIGGIRQDIAARAASNFAFLGGNWWL